MFRWLILALFLYLVFKYASYLMELVGAKSSSSSSGKFKSNSNNSSSNERVDVKYNPGKKEKRYDEGEYIDYEEVKD